MKIKGKELSEETVAKACEAYGISLEKKLGPIQVCCLFVEVVDETHPIQIRSNHTGKYHYNPQGNTIKESKIVEQYSLEEAIEFIKALQTAIEYVKTET